MTRLGGKMPFAQAVEEMRHHQGVQIEESTLRGITHRYGKIAEAVAREEVAQIEAGGVASLAKPEKVLVSVDGAFVRLTSGEWHEVKTMIVGDIEAVREESTQEGQVITKDISYFSRSCGIREFERLALAELHRRGVFNAKSVVTVNDGADWTQSFADYHFPQATRILDFRHATDYLTTAGQAALGEGTSSSKEWLERTTHQLKHEPPQQTLDDVRSLQTDSLSKADSEAVDQAYHYLKKREAMINYPHFRECGLPIGSGSVESSHKVVVHPRLKQAGMRWAQHHLDPMLALRNLICNDRWDTGWSQIVAHYWQQRRQEFQRIARCQRPYSPCLPTPVAEPSPVALPEPSPAALAQPSTTQTPLLPSEPVPDKKQPYCPAPNHPWRRGIWPSRRTGHSQ